MKGFAGFPAGEMKFTPLPNLFFSAVLPQTESLAELKVTLHIFWLLHQKKGFPRYVTRQELTDDGTLISGLRKLGEPLDELERGLQLAIARGTLLQLTVDVDGAARELYFLNTARGREVVQKLRAGELDIGQLVVLPTEKVTGRAERPNIFVLYEQNIGLLTPMIAEELREAEKLYPEEWIDSAFRQAVGYNRRSWKYIQRILERWAIEGRSDEKGGRAH